MKNIKLILSVTAGLLAGVTAASAADLAARPYAKAPAVMADPGYSWTGFYIGGDVGGAWGLGTDVGVKAKAGSSRTDQFFPNQGSGGTWAAGVYAGYNYQVNPAWVVGVEGDYTWMHKSTTTEVPISFGGLPSGSFYDTSHEQNGLASLRARLGYSFGKTLLYGTAGVAWSMTSDFGQQTSGACAGFCTTGTNHFTDVGFVAGAGAEYAVTNNVIVRGQYLYYGTHATHSVLDACPAGVCSFSDTPHTYTWTTRDIQIGSVGISYKFGGPVVAKY